MTNREIAAKLEEMGSILELQGENPFKCRAFQNAARVIAASTADLRAAAGEGSLIAIAGIGKGIAPIIAGFALNGRSEEYDRLCAALPRGLLELLKVQGLGPRKVRMLHETLGIDSTAMLLDAARNGRLTGLSGFGKKSEENILRGLVLLERDRGKRLLPEAEAAAEAVVARLRGVRGVIDCTTAGSLRRRAPVVGDIDILACAQRRDAPAVIEAFTTHPDAAGVLAGGSTKGSFVLGSGFQCDLRVVEPAEYPFALQYFTGSKAHNVELRGLAAGLGWSLNEYGFTRLEARATGRPGGRSSIPPDCTDEAAVYAALGLACIPPELREASGEIDAARGGALPHLVTYEDLRGTFHCHTTYSDGLNTVREMAEGARMLKWEYLGIADHSKAAAYAGGLSERDVARQLAEIGKLNASMRGFRIFAGTEVDILADGSLDWSDAVLERFDYVVASVHSRFSMSEQEATRRIIRAVMHPRVTMLGHPTGRLLLERDGYPLNVREVIDAAADHGTMIEINANPRRLDLDPPACRYAREKGVMIVINPDAHSVAGLRDARFGVDVARKGWLGPRDVLNTRPTDETAQLLGRGRK